jgi:glycosyltransferase involved in cell wall biosynthesis
MLPLVSILIPCYNAEAWLAETLESAIAQTWKNTEIIVVDDGSSDQSFAIAKQFESAQIKVLQQPKQGASVARNLALQVCQGDYLQYLDADDLLHPDKIELQLKGLQRNPPNNLAICATTHFFDGTDPAEGTFHNGGISFSDSDDSLAWLIRLLGGDGSGAMVASSAWLIPRSVAEIAGNWNEQLTVDDDGEYFARVILASTGIRYIDGALSYYRKYTNSQSLSSLKSLQHQQSALRSLELKADYIFSKTNSVQAKRAISRCYMEIAVATYPKFPEISRHALKEIKALGVSVPVPVLGSQTTEILKQILGWKAAKLINMQYHNLKQQWRRA